MNIDRPKLAIGTFSATLVVAFAGMALLPSTRVDYAYKVAWLGRGYLSISVWNLRKNIHTDVNLTRVTDKNNNDIQFTNPGHGIWHIDTDGHKTLNLFTIADKRKRTISVTISGPSTPAVVDIRGPVAFRCKDMGFMAVPLEGVPVFGLPNPFRILPRQESGALSPVLPALLRLEFRSSGKSVTLNFKQDRTPIVRMPVQPARPLVFNVMMGDRRICRYSYYLEGRAKGMVMDKTPVLLNTHRPVFHARLRIFSPPMHIHCMTYARHDVSLKGPLAYKFIEPSRKEAEITMPLPQKPGLYYVICTPDPITPLYYYVRRNVMVADTNPGAKILAAMDDFPMPKKDRQTIISLEKTGRITAAMDTLSAEMPDLLPPVKVLVNTVEIDKKDRAKKHEKAASILFYLIGAAFAGITIWLVMVSVGAHKGLQQALAEEGTIARTQWYELALFVVINLVNVTALLYTLYLVFF